MLDKLITRDTFENMTARRLSNAARSIPPTKLCCISAIPAKKPMPQLSARKPIGSSWWNDGDGLGYNCNCPHGNDAGFFSKAHIARQEPRIAATKTFHATLSPD
jgi:hypothetical protein